MKTSTVARAVAAALIGVPLAGAPKFAFANIKAADSRAGLMT